MTSLLTSLPEPLILLVAAIIMTAESGLGIGVFLPATSTALALGLLARLGAVPAHSAVLTVAAATALGSHCAFLLSRGRGPAQFLLKHRRVQPWLDRAESLLRRRPVAGSAAGHLVGGTRTVVPRIAARAGVPYARFAMGTVPAAAVWAALLVTLGYIAGAAFDQIRLAVSLIGPPLLLVALIVYCLKRAGRRADDDRAARLLTAE